MSNYIPYQFDDPCWMGYKLVILRMNEDDVYDPEENDILIRTHYNGMDLVLFILRERTTSELEVKDDDEA